MGGGEEGEGEGQGEGGGGGGGWGGGGGGVEGGGGGGGWGGGGEVFSELNLRELHPRRLEDKEAKWLIESPQFPL